MTSATAISHMEERAGAARILHIDIIRGVAVFGLIWSNLNAGFYSGPTTNADVVARWASSVFSGGKFFTLFSLLFGVTLAMQLARADERPRPIVARWLRRMVILFAIGWAHALLFWPGDILRDYAISGVVLILFRRASIRTILAAAVVALTLASNRESLSIVTTRFLGRNVSAVERRELPDSTLQLRRKAMGAASQTGSYAAVVRTRFWQQSGEWVRRASPPAGPLNWIPTWYLGLFLLGLVLGRQQIVQRPDLHSGAVLALMLAGLALGLPLNVYLTASPAWLTSHWASWPLAITARLTLSLGYLGSLLWLLQRGRWSSRLRVLAPVGRMGLSNYIMQTAFLTFLKLGYGLGLESVLGWFECFVIAACFYAAQVWWSNWWLRSFRLGPVEWLWRRLTIHGSLPSS